MIDTKKSLRIDETLDAFRHLNLSDSFLMDILESEHQVKLIVEVLLDEQHHAFCKPNEGETGCYRQAEILFPNVRKVVWKENRLIPISDRDGLIDYGGIDEFYCSGHHYHLSGEWGTVEIVSDTPQLILKGVAS